ncbi:MAG TPA: hypothetical protein VF950_19110 [Planctomycetota bacterium]
MGGKLFNLPRMPRDEYLERERAMRAYLDGTLGRYRIPRFYGDKPDFGDMDILVPSRPDWDEVRARIVKDLGITETKAVGKVFSTVYRGLQTDFFALADRFVDCAGDFMSFNDLGNLLGRICRRFNLKWGEEGLSYVCRRANGDHYAADLPITLDFARVCAFLKLDHAAWVAGFPTLVSLFEWVVTCPYFSVAPYLDDPAGPIGVRRDRPTIAKFVAFLRERRIDARPVFEDKASYVPLVSAAFPEAGLEAMIAAERLKEARAAEVSAKFNGKLVMRLRPELTGRALGEFIVAFKTSIPDFETFVLQSSSEEIERRIAAFVEAD